MTVYNNKRVESEVFQIDPRIKSGWFSDVYFNNTQKILTALVEEGYTFGENTCDLLEIDTSDVEIGNLHVEMQFFTRRKPLSLVVGVDEALAILKTSTGYYEGDRFINTYDQLEVEAVHDGTLVHYNGNPLEVKPILKVRGRYRDFAHLETVLLGVLSEPTRIATNVYNTMVAANGKDILFFPARFAHYKMQGVHGYAHKVATEAYNHHYKRSNNAFVSTHEQGAWWGGKGAGTIAHATIALFLGNTPETMLQFSRVMEVEIPRIVLVDFHNDCVGETQKVMSAMFEKYWYYHQKGAFEMAKKYSLYGVRPDTSGNMIDQCIDEPTSKDDFGVNAKLVWRLRKAIDSCYINWQGVDTSTEKEKVAKAWCQGVKIVVTGGFNVEKINQFERLGVPVDIYGVGSSLLTNDKKSNNDFTADVVKVKIDDTWHNLSKVGRRAIENKDLRIV